MNRLPDRALTLYPGTGLTVKWPTGWTESMITEMKRVTVYALCALLFAATTGQAIARYDCRATGVQDQASCCCDMPAEDGAAAQCGCCDVRYEDATPKVAGAKSKLIGGHEMVALDVVSDVSTVVLDRSAVTTYSRDDPGPPLDGPARFILFCSFLC